MKDSLHTMLRSIRGETKSRPDHLSVFREFLDHLDRISRRNVKRAPPHKRSKPSGRRSRKS